VLGDERQGAGPEGVDQLPGQLREVRDEPVQRVRGADEDGSGHVAAPAFGLQQVGDRLRGERVGADAVHRVRRQHHELATADGGRCLTQTGHTVGRVVGVVSPCHL
jgi:hypothetical protein